MASPFSSRRAPLALLLPLLFLLTLPQASPATMYGDASRNVSSDTPVGTAQSPLLTSIFTSPPYSKCSPQVQGTNIVVEKPQGGALAISVRSTSNGSEVWGSADPVVPNAAGRECPAADATRVVVARDTNRLQAYTLADGTTAWTRTFFGGTDLSAPVLAGDRVYVTEINGSFPTVRALDATTGTDVWERSTTASAQPVLLTDDAVVVEHPSQLTGLDRDDGTVAWTFPVPAGTVRSVIVAGGSVLVAHGTASAGTVTALNPATGAERWNASVAGAARLVADATRVYAHVDGKELRALAAQDGTTAWTTATTAPHGCLSRFDDQIHLGSSSARATYRTTDGTLIRPGAAIWDCTSAPVVAGTRVFGWSTDALVRMVDTAPPAVTATPEDGGAVASRRPTLTWNVRDAEVGGVGVDTVSVKLDGAEIATTASGSYVPATDLAEGAHTLTVVATDRRGNTASPARTFAVDTAAPATPVFSAPGTAYSRGVNVPVELQATDAGGGATTIELSVGGQLHGTLTGCEDGCSTTIASVPEGSTTLSAVAVDAAGQRSAAATRTVLADRSGPAGQALTAPADGATVLPGEVKLTWTAASDAGVGLSHYDVYLDGTKIASPPGLEATATVGAGSHTWHVIAVDTLGNEGAPVSRSFTAATPDPDPGPGPGTGQKPAPAGPPCVEATPQSVEYTDGFGDNNGAADLAIMRIDVAADCSVRLVFGLDTNVLNSAETLVALLDVDSDDATGSSALKGVDRFLSVNGPSSNLSADIAIIDPATGDVGSIVAPRPTATPELQRLIEVRTTVAALGLTPGKPAGLAFRSLFRPGSNVYSDLSPELGMPDHPLTVDFRSTSSGGGTPPQDPPPTQNPPVEQPPAGQQPQQQQQQPQQQPAAPQKRTTPQQPGGGGTTPATPDAPKARLTGTAKVGKTLTCATPAGMSRPAYTWTRNGKAIRGAKKAKLKLRGADAGKTIGCRVRGKVGGKTVTVTAPAKKVARR